jgi:hypothetical protein
VQICESAHVWSALTTEIHELSSVVNGATIRN